MLSAGANPSWVAAQLGHKDAETTLRIYAHVVRGVKKVSAEILDKGGSKQTTRKCGPLEEETGGEKGP